MRGPFGAKEEQNLLQEKCASLDWRSRKARQHKKGRRDFHNSISHQGKQPPDAIKRGRESFIGIHGSWFASHHCFFHRNTSLCWQESRSSSICKTQNQTTKKHKQEKISHTSSSACHIPESTPTLYATSLGRGGEKTHFQLRWKSLREG